MRWADVCAAHPDQWLVIEALEAHTENQHRVFDRIAVVESCPDGAAALRRYRELHGEHRVRELYFVHTANAVLDVEERSWTGIRRGDATHHPR
jgi:hypothetical protein